MPSLRSWFNLASSTHCRHCRGGGGGGGGGGRWLGNGHMTVTLPETLEAHTDPAAVSWQPP